MTERNNRQDLEQQLTNLTTLRQRVANNQSGVRISSVDHPDFVNLTSNLQQRILQNGEIVYVGLNGNITIVGKNERR